MSRPSFHFVIPCAAIVFALIGIASDIRENYFFRRIGGRWFLVRVEDLSM